MVLLNPLGNTSMVIGEAICYYHWAVHLCLQKPEISLNSCSDPHMSTHDAKFESVSATQGLSWS